MNIREKQQMKESMQFSVYAAFSSLSKGRAQAEEECDIRTCYQRDRDRILHCKSFRRLKDKTQVFMSPKGDHYRTRLTHTLEVSQTARTIASALELNEDLTEAIALGHDLGHTPFGHAGEHALNRICKHGFRHYDQSLRVVEVLEKDGKGLNLTYEVRNGIRNHSSANMPDTLEGKIVRLSDKIAYVNHDIDDAIRGHVITAEELPIECTKILGKNFRERSNTMIRAMIAGSEGKNDICMEEAVYKAMLNTRAFMFEKVYRHPGCIKEEEKVSFIIEHLYEYFMKHKGQMPEGYSNRIGESCEDEMAVIDYIAGMTDHYAIEKFRQSYEPVFWMG